MKMFKNRRSSKPQTADCSHTRQANEEPHSNHIRRYNSHFNTRGSYFSAARVSFEPMKFPLKTNIAQCIRQINHFYFIVFTFIRNHDLLEGMFEKLWAESKRLISHVCCSLFRFWKNELKNLI